MKFNNPYFTEVEKINLLERWIMVHSFIYYKLSENVVSDQMYDANCIQLAKLIKSYPKAYSKSKYCKEFKNYNPSTGYDLISKLNKRNLNYIKLQAAFVLAFKQTPSYGGK